jgi:predicted polyphosphate/ATP-dependent NAD kinase
VPVAVEGRLLEDALVLAGIVLSLAAARRVFAVSATLPTASAPKRAVLFYDPKSAGGKAERFHVSREARARDVEPVELHLGDDLAMLVRDAVANGADAVGVAGGDGTQAIVAAIASERGLPYVCVPAGTRNHFALVSASTATTSRERSTRSQTDVSEWSTSPRSTAGCS